MKKVGRPKNKKPNDDSIFIGMKMPKHLAKSLTEDAAKHFRMRSQHILWILTDYIVSEEFNKSKNKPLYTEGELDDMYKQYKENK
jgi:hypothetical protein